MTATTARNWGRIADAAELLSVDQKTVRRMIARGDIEAHRIGTRLIRVDLNSIRTTPIGNAR